MSTALDFSFVNTRKILEQHGYQVEVFNKHSLASDLAVSTSIDLIVINLDQLTASDLDFCKALHAKASLPILVLAAQESEVSTQAILDSAISSYGVGEFDHKRLITMADVAIERFKQIQSLKEELDHSKQQLKQRKVIERAKGMIMTHRGLNENDAYNHMRRAAMDQGKSIASFAEQIIQVLQIIEKEQSQDGSN